MIQNSGTVKVTLRRDQEAFHCHKTIRQGRDSKTHSRMNSDLLGVKFILWWYKEWLIFWWPHVGIFQPPLKTPQGVFFCIYIYIYIIFFVKVNATHKHSGLIPIFWSKGGNVCLNHHAGYIHLPLEWLEPPSHLNRTVPSCLLKT